MLKVYGNVSETIVLVPKTIIKSFISIISSPTKVLNTVELL